MSAAQHGALSRQQALAAGLTDEVIDGNLAALRWQRAFPGVYVTFTGPLPYLTRVWAGLLYVGDGAMASHETAAYLQTLRDNPPEDVYVTVDARRRVRRQPGLRICRTRAAEARRHPVRTPPQTRLEDTVLDRVDEASTVHEVVAVLSGACQRRLTTAPRLAGTAARRGRRRWRALVDDVLSDIVDGVQSALERLYYRNVEGAHGLPQADRNRTEGVRGHRRYRDARYRSSRLSSSSTDPPRTLLRSETPTRRVTTTSSRPRTAGRCATAGPRSPGRRAESPARLAGFCSGTVGPASRAAADRRASFPEVPSRQILTGHRSANEERGN